MLSPLTYHKFSYQQCADQNLDNYFGLTNGVKDTVTDDVKSYCFTGEAFGNVEYKNVYESESMIQALLTSPSNQAIIDSQQNKHGGENVLALYSKNHVCPKDVRSNFITIPSRFLETPVHVKNIFSKIFSKEFFYRHNSTDDTDLRCVFVQSVYDGTYHILSPGLSNSIECNKYTFGLYTIYYEWTVTLKSPPYDINILRYKRGAWTISPFNLETQSTSWLIQSSVYPLVYVQGYNDSYNTLRLREHPVPPQELEYAWILSI